MRPCEAERSSSAASCFLVFRLHSYESHAWCEVRLLQVDVLRARWCSQLDVDSNQCLLALRTCEMHRTKITCWGEGRGKEDDDIDEHDRKKREEILRGGKSMYFVMTKSISVSRSVLEYVGMYFTRSNYGLVDHVIINWFSHDFTFLPKTKLPYK